MLSETSRPETISKSCDNTANTIHNTGDTNVAISKETVALDDGREGMRNVTVVTLKKRTPSQSDFFEKQTVIETDFATPEGARHHEQDVITTRKKVTRHGSDYYERKSVSQRRVAPPSSTGEMEYVTGDVLVEQDSFSATRGQHCMDSAQLVFLKEEEEEEEEEEGGINVIASSNSTPSTSSPEEGTARYIRPAVFDFFVLHPLGTDKN